jgi:hypothetical protein
MLEAIKAELEFNVRLGVDFPEGCGQGHVWQAGTIVTKGGAKAPDRIIEDVIALQREYRCVVWAVEAVQLQEFLRTELVKRSGARRLRLYVLLQWRRQVREGGVVMKRRGDFVSGQDGKFIELEPAASRFVFADSVR